LRTTYRDVLRSYPLAQLQSSPSNYIYVVHAGLGLQMEEMLETIQVRLDPQISLTQVDENGDMED